MEKRRVAMELLKLAKDLLADGPKGDAAMKEIKTRKDVKNPEALGGWLRWHRDEED